MGGSEKSKKANSPSKASGSRSTSKSSKAYTPTRHQSKKEHKDRPAKRARTVDYSDSDTEPEIAPTMADFARLEAMIQNLVSKNMPPGGQEICPMTIQPNKIELPPPPSCPDGSGSGQPRPEIRAFPPPQQVPSASAATFAGLYTAAGTSGNQGHRQTASLPPMQARNPCPTSTQAAQSTQFGLHTANAPATLPTPLGMLPNMQMQQQVPLLEQAQGPQMLNTHDSSRGANLQLLPQQPHAQETSRGSNLQQQQGAFNAFTTNQQPAFAQNTMQAPLGAMQNLHAQQHIPLYGASTSSQLLQNNEQMQGSSLLQQQAQMNQYGNNTLQHLGTGPATYQSGLQYQQPLQEGIYHNATQMQQGYQMPLEFNPYAAASYPGANLSDAIKEKIKGDKYVDFYEIKNFNPYETTTDTQHHVCAVKHAPKKRKELTYPEWLSAFHQFFGVYVGFYPHLAQQLNAYGAFINFLCLNDYSWAHYDREFRIEREHTKIPWTFRRTDLQNDAGFKFKRLQPTNSGDKEKFRSPKGNDPAWKHGYCFLFNKKDLYCSESADCKFKHACTKCDKHHPYCKHDFITKKMQNEKNRGHHNTHPHKHPE